MSYATPKGNSKSFLPLGELQHRIDYFGPDPSKKRAIVSFVDASGSEDDRYTVALYQLAREQRVQMMVALHRERSRSSTAAFRDRGRDILQSLEDSIANFRSEGLLIAIHGVPIRLKSLSLSGL